MCISLNHLYIIIYIVNVEIINYFILSNKTQTFNNFCKHWSNFGQIHQKIHKQNINNLKLKKTLWSNVKNKCTFTGNNDSKVWPDFFLASGIQNVCAMIFLLNSLFYMHKTLWPSITWWVPYILQRIDVKSIFRLATFDKIRSSINEIFLWNYKWSHDLYLIGCWMSHGLLLFLWQWHNLRLFIIEINQQMSPFKLLFV